MKKRTLLMLSFLLVAVLVSACGTDTPAQTNTETTPVETPEEPVVEETEEPVVEEEETEETAAQAVHFYTRDATSGTREAFEDGIGLDGDVTANAVETSGNGDMASKVGSDTSGIGYVSLTTDFEANNIRPVNYEGVEPTIDNVLDDSYALKRPFSFVTRAAGDYADENTEALVNAFIAFITQSEEGLSAVESEGGIVDLSNAKPWSEVATTVSGFDPAKDYSAVTLRTRGSTSVEKTLTAALEAFQAEVQYNFNMDHTGSGDGYKRVLGEEKDGANAGDIGFASRPFGDEEDVSTGAASGVYCQDAVVIAVHADNPLENITSDQIKGIVLGDITDWSELQ